MKLLILMNTSYIIIRTDVGLGVIFYSDHNVRLIELLVNSSLNIEEIFYRTMNVTRRNRVKVTKQDHGARVF